MLNRHRKYLFRFSLVALILIIVIVNYVVYEGIDSLGLIARYRIPDFDGTATSCRCRDLQPNDKRIQWPPARIPEDLTCEDGTIDLTLCIQADGTRGSRRDGASREEAASQVQMLADPQNWYHLGKTRNYDSYPLAVNMTEIIEDLRRVRSTEYKPITNPNIKLIRHSRNACSPENPKESHDLVAIYKSGVFNFEDRARMRASYANLPPGIRVVFITGLPPPRLHQSSGSPPPSNLFHMNGGFDMRLPDRAGATAEKWTERRSEALQTLFAEADEHGDLVIMDFVDTYVNLTYKLIASHRWASAFCQGKTDVFLFMDDDFVFVPRNMLAYLSQLSHQQRRELLSGPILHLRHVIRPSKNPWRNKWAVTHAEVPWSQFAPYVSGAAIFVGADVLNELVITEAYSRFLWVDDVYLGFVVAKLPHRRFSAMKGFYVEATNDGKAIVTHSRFKFSLTWFLETLFQIRNEFFFNFV